ncbi:hypothetical protein MKX03_006310 [Papaver bracteatum]|nr:hypothetical protein MKX03_006310 [Papaver bracteatum]
MEKIAFSPSFSHLFESFICFCMRSNLSNPRSFLNSSTCFPSLKCLKFKEASKTGNLIPLRKCIFSDHLTPVLAYHVYIIGARPTMEIIAKENVVTIMDHEEGSKTEEIVEDPMVIPRRLMEGWTPQIIHELPDAFCEFMYPILMVQLNLWVGYFSYDTVRYLENKKLPFSAAPKDDRNLADTHLGFYDDVIVFDHVEKVRLDRYSSVEEDYKDGMRRLEALTSKVHDIDPPRLAAGLVNIQRTPSFGSQINTSSMLSEAYKKVVLEAKDHILAGDVFQIVLSQRFERRTFATPFEVWVKRQNAPISVVTLLKCPGPLRVVNPNPYMTYLHARGCILVASSPEILTCVKKREIVMRPLAGTISRGTTMMEDKMAQKQLLADKKQCAEHIMLVSKPGSVKVEKLMSIERYSHVMHISSTITGELLNDCTCWDALRASLPVGTVSGAPKVYCCCSFHLFSSDRREWVAHIQIGAGIVADSNPDDELRECENKATALVRAVELAESTFVDSY